MTRLLPIFYIFFLKISGYSLVICCGHTQKPRDFGEYTSMWGASVCSNLSNLTSAVIYYHKLGKTNNVASGDFHRSSAPWMIFQCTLSTLKLFSQSCHCRTFRNIVTLCPNPTLMDFISIFSFFCEGSDDCPTIVLVMPMFRGVRIIPQSPLSEERLHRPVFFFFFFFFFF